MLGQYADLGCSSADPACVCMSINFYYGICDFSNGACSADVASTVIIFESRYCASATAAPTVTRPKRSRKLIDGVEPVVCRVSAKCRRDHLEQYLDAACLGLNKLKRSPRVRIGDCADENRFAMYGLVDGVAEF
ncbi:cfem domain-containing protein [Ophiostoma piceae UAMH 11346]|uniref:Cfem domain-containing protein n=1 Tax=Ophiostoma piceae (strain UAMH 11346) TaxID=1262450 RepID=S3C947_OPHP1|nr:cfem domain-containing protein [Ophiostoma piceae UAMH 11346]